MWRWRRRSDEDFSEEIQANIALDTDRLVAEGLSPEDARAAALRAFGNVTRAQERFYESHRTIWLDDLQRDVRYALRGLIKNPGFTAVVVLTLALGIGANAAIFSVVNSLLLRSLPVAEPQRLVTISSNSAVSMGFRAGLGWNYAMWDQFRQRAQVFDGAFAWTTNRFNLAQSGERQPVDGIYASGEFFTTLGVPALLGRTFSPADDVRGGGPAGPVAVISYGLWQRRFGGTANIIGTPLVVGRVPFTIIGVTPPEFFGVEIGQAFDVALPLSTEPLISGKDAAIDAPRRFFLLVMLRLKPGQSVNVATAALRAMQPQILGVMGNGLPPFLKEPFTLVPAATGTADRLRQQYERPLLTVLLVVTLVLLIACLNIANLLLTRATARRHEFSVRLAIGASGWRLGQPLLVESMILAVAGASVGLIAAGWGSHALVGQLSADGDRIVLNLSLDWRVLTFTAAVTVATAILFGAAPALRATRVTPMSALKEQGRSASDGVRASVSSSLLVVQVALSLILVVAAGLFVRTFARLANVSLGFDGGRVLLTNVDMTRTRVDPADRNSFDNRLVAAVASVPGVASAAGSLFTPAGGGANLLRDARGRAVDPGRVVGNFITPGWFAVYGIPIRAGRDATDHDSSNAPLVVMVNEAFVRKFSLGRDVIGATFDESISGFLKSRTVVGVVGDAVYGSLRDAAPPTVYVPLAQSSGLTPPGRTTLIVSTRPVAGSPASLAPSVAAALTAMDRDLAFSFRPLADQVSASLTQERLLARLSGFFGGLALLLAGLGLYGITSYAVTRRRTEIGIRMALGAAPTGIVRLALTRIATLVGIGVAVGAVVSLWASRFVASLLYGLEPRDPVTLVGAALVLVAVGLFAGWLPAWRASRIDPAQVLRES